MKRLAVFAAVVVTSCAATKPQPDPQPQRAPATAVDPQVDIFRGRMLGFLAARWSHDPVAIQPFIVATDRDLAEKRLQPHGPERDDPISRVEWKLLTAEVNGDEAIATVEVIRPFNPIFFWFGGVDIDWVMSLPPEKQEAAAKQMRVDREIRTLTYRARREGDEWLLVMSWETEDHAHPNMWDRENTKERKQQLIDNFPGSEPELLFETASLMLTPDTPLVTPVREAESLVEDHEFDRAIARYDEILTKTDMPAFVVKRRQGLDALREQHEERLRRANVVLTTTAAGTSVEVVAVGAGEPLRELEVALDAKRDDRERRLTETGRFRNRPLERTTFSFRLWDGELLKGDARVVDVRFHNEPEQAPAWDQPPLEFRRALKDVSTRGASRAHGIRIAQDIRLNSQAFDSCPDWPHTAIDLRIEVVEGKTIAFDVIGDASREFRGCVTERSKLFPFTDTDNGAVMLRLYPPRG